MELSFQEILLLNYHWRLSVWGYLGKIICCMGFPSGPLVKNPPANSGGTRDLVGRIPWSRKWLPTPVFLPGKSHGQRSLAGHCPWGRNESDMTEHACTAIFFTKVVEKILTWIVYFSSCQTQQHQKWWVLPEYQVRALVSCIQPGPVICFTLDSIHVPGGSGWGGRWEAGLGWGRHVNPRPFHFNVWQNSLQKKKPKNGGL